MTAEPNAWQLRHQAAINRPTAQEAPLVNMLRVIDHLVEMHAEDYVLREGVADIIKGVRVLLNADLGPRLDMGTVDHQLCDAAATIGYCLDCENFSDDDTHGAHA